MTVLGHDDDDIDVLIELDNVYDGWSILKLKDGTLINRWADPETGLALEGYERRWQLTQDAIDHARNEPS
jgi:hypothetical protein